MSDSITTPNTPDSGPMTFAPVSTFSYVLNGVSNGAMLLGLPVAVAKLGFKANISDARTALIASIGGVIGGVYGYMEKDAVNGYRKSIADNMNRLYEAVQTHHALPAPSAHPAREPVGAHTAQLEAQRTSGTAPSRTS